MTANTDPFEALYHANRDPDNMAYVHTRDGLAILCWRGDDGVLRFAAPVKGKKR
jgi:hypothetical protein